MTKNPVLKKEYLIDFRKPLLTQKLLECEPSQSVFGNRNKFLTFSKLRNAFAAPEDLVGALDSLDG